MQVQQQQQHTVTKDTKKGSPRKPAQKHSINGSHLSSGSPASQTSHGADIVLYYYTGWSQAKLHYSVNAGEWQDRDFEQVLPTVIVVWNSVCQKHMYGSQLPFCLSSHG